MRSDLIHPNGVNGLTGAYLLPPVAPSDVAARVRRPAGGPAVLAELATLGERLHEPTLGLPFDVRPDDLSQAGWAVVFGAGETDQVRAALEPLIEHRARVAGARRVKVLDHRPGERWQDWLARHRVGPGTVDPRQVPYYVLLIGGPERIPFEFQYLLSVEYAVGRLHFDDVTGYQRYAASLVDHEEAAGSPRQAAAAFFAPRHAADLSTQLASDLLVRPLAGSFRPGGRFAGAVRGYRIAAPLVAEGATKAALLELLEGNGLDNRPALVFLAAHGLGGWPAGHPDQTARHGAVVCQDWPGPGQIDPDHYLAASDIARGARPHGMIAFLYACYGAGTPELEPFHVPDSTPARVADAPFVAALPKRLLAHPEGGALAVIGHVDRAWGYSFLSGGQAQLLPFQNAVGRILSGQPVGHAMKDFSERYAALSANVSTLLRQTGYGRPVGDEELAMLWTERTDAQNYVVLGDPAARLKPV
jgi:hypothetical protein